MKCFFNLKDEARSAQTVGAVSRLWGAEVLPMNDLSLWHFNRNGKRTEALGQKSVKGDPECGINRSLRLVHGLFKAVAEVTGDTPPHTLHLCRMAMGRKRLGPGAVNGAAAGVRRKT